MRLLAIEAIEWGNGNPLIEFVGRDDEMVEALLRNKDDQYDDYRLEAFEALLSFRSSRSPDAEEQKEINLSLCRTHCADCKRSRWPANRVRSYCGGRLTRADQDESRWRSH